LFPCSDCGIYLCAFFYLQVCRDLGKHLHLEIMVSTGGSSLQEDILRLMKPVHIMISTVRK